MKVHSIRREIQILRVYTLVSTVAAGAFLLGAVHESKNASFDTVTLHQINVVDREGKLAMVITNHDNAPDAIINGKHVRRSDAGDDNEIVFYNELGNEQGALAWNGRIKKDGSFQSGNVLSYDSVKSDQLLQVDAFNDNGHQSAYMIGWNEPDNSTSEAQAFSQEWHAAKTDAQKRAVHAKYPNQRIYERFFFGNDGTQSRVMLHDAKGRPRINMFVTNDGQAELQFLDADGKVTYQLPQ
ncbi:MAG TPA: hypothetical protein VFO29_01600 [Candidatus Rubrimentiphilum sp.]|nr:hypothetical protein [Candidatus Rubrimentiphilum sp.]